MKRVVFTLCAATIAVSCTWSATSAAAAATLCVGGPGCFATIQAAVNAAHDSDTITIAPGTFAGAVIFEFNRVVICRTCGGPSAASVPRGRVIRISFDRHTHQLNASMQFCESRSALPRRALCLHR